MNLPKDPKHLSRSLFAQPTVHTWDIQLCSAHRTLQGGVGCVIVVSTRRYYICYVSAMSTLLEIPGFEHQIDA